MTLSEFQNFITPFLTYLQSTKNRAAHTQRAYRADLHELLHFWEHKESQEKRTFDLSLVLMRYMQNIAHKQFTATTIARKCSCFNSFEKFMHQVHGRELNLTLIRPVIQHKLPELLTFEEIQYLIETMPLSELALQRPYRDRAIFQLLYATGMLTSEIIQLRLEHINLSENTLLIQSPTKNRSLTFNHLTAQKLTDYVTHERKKPTTPHEYFFLNHRDEPLTTRSIQRICRAFSKKLSRSLMITPFLLRYSGASHLLTQGKSISELNEILGHRCMVSTQRYFQIFEHKA
ncbi:MAG: tyrosine-type recombinase/integrase [Candidatus Babeliaceae bacterium]